MKTLEQVATIICTNNPKLKELASDPTKGYNNIKASIDGATMKQVGKAIGGYVSKNDLIWAIVNESQGKQSLNLTGL